MKTIFLLTLIATVTVCGLLACSSVGVDDIPPVLAGGIPVKKTMKPFGSERELAQYIREWSERQKRRERQAAKITADSAGLSNPSAPVAASAKLASTAIAAEESVTNTQHSGVDEGGIVKVHGDHLVVLRRGRLFTVAIGDGALKPISTVDAFGPEMNPTHTWYDEMLVSGNTVVVIGYSYERGGTEVGLFNIDKTGQLAYRSTYHLRSNDYYSSRNYASRLIGNKLIFYTPQFMYAGAENPFDQFPAVRKWHKNAKPEEFQRIVPATRVYRPQTAVNMDWFMSLHTVTVCDLANGGFDCQATTVMGPPGHVFYVSQDSVYVWASSWGRNSRENSILFRMPLDGSGPSALRTSGSPVDQFSFLEGEDKHLNVLVRSGSKGDGMWAAEVAEGDVALLQIPIMAFSDGSEMAPGSWYKPLKKPTGEGYNFQNRFVGNYLLYGTGTSWGYPDEGLQKADLFIVNWSNGNSHQLTLPHGVDRIEQMNADAVVVGTDGENLHFSSVRLLDQPQIVSRYTRKEASQGELRSHGFFYKPEGSSSGMLGLPISTPGRPGFQHLFESSAAILFLRNDSLQFSEVGELGSQPEKAVNDNCRASCVDWYGNARPLFLRGRVFALLGYELVEGHLEQGRIRELRRVNYAPV